MKCRGFTVRGEECKNNVVVSDGEVSDYCRFHKVVANLPRPDCCCVCTDPLDTEPAPLECGHWVHRDCIVKSAKAECPLCRATLSRLGRTAMKEIQRLRQIRIQEEIEEEQQEIIRSFQSIDEILDAELSPYIHSELNRLLETIIESEATGAASSPDQHRQPSETDDPTLVNLAYQMYHSTSYNELINAINDFFS